MSAEFHDVEAVLNMHGGCMHGGFIVHGNVLHCIYNIIANKVLKLIISEVNYSEGF